MKTLLQETMLKKKNKYSNSNFKHKGLLMLVYAFNGTVLMISTATSGGKVTATGSASGGMDFEASAFQCYDIYADHRDISID